MSGKQGRGRPISSWIRGIKQAVGGTMANAVPTSDRQRGGLVLSNHGHTSALMQHITKKKKLGPGLDSISIQ